MTRPKKDMALVCGVTEDRQGLNVVRLRAASGDVELGAVRPLREGTAITGEVVRLKPLPEAPLVCEVETEIAREESTGRTGPAQVANDRYRRGWDAIWGAEPETTPGGSSALN